MNAQPDHLFDGPARATDADIGLLEVLVRALQLHPLSKQTPEHFLPHLFVLEREAVRIFEPLRTRVERLGRLEEAGALGGRVGEGVDVVVIFILYGIGRVGWSGGKEEISFCHGSERGLVGGGMNSGVSSCGFRPNQLRRRSPLNINETRATLERLGGGEAKAELTTFAFQDFTSCRYARTWAISFALPLPWCSSWSICGGGGMGVRAGGSFLARPLCR